LVLTDNRRRHPRTPLNWQICVWHESFGELCGQTRDFSDGGVYIQLVELTHLPLGTRLIGQIQGLPNGAPRVEMEIRWADARGVGLRFVV
jgi:hypothetical protein